MRLSPPAPKKPRTVSAEDEMSVERRASRPPVAAAAVRPPTDDGIPVPVISSLDSISLTSHADGTGVDPLPISWGHPDPAVRGPVICTVRHAAQRNAIGAHSGSYCVYTGLAGE